MPIENIITEYYCSFCENEELIFRDLKNCEWHERECRNNPVNKSCLTCKHSAYYYGHCLKKIPIKYGCVNVKCKEWEGKS
jgi:hypothetical protein